MGFSLTRSLKKVAAFLKPLDLDVKAWEFLVAQVARQTGLPVELVDKALREAKRIVDGD